MCASTSVIIAVWIKIIELYEKKEREHLYSFYNVTMQNHGGYSDTYDNFTPDITVEGVESTPLSQYLSLVRLSDQALEKTDFLF